MGITRIPQQVASSVQDAAENLQYQGSRILDNGLDKNWVRTVAAGSLVTGAVSGLPGNLGRYANGSLISGQGAGATINSVLSGVTTARTAVQSAATEATNLAGLL